ncbi:MAG: MBOAT family protein [Lachnospiraceae bacterium]|nr:MBOAT family protein [Lachnospiraceae bacterium]
MIFNSVAFAVFFPIIVIIYFLMPSRYRNVWLLGSSYIYYMSQEPYYLILLLASTISTYFAAIALDKFRGRKISMRITAGIAVVFNLGLLVFFKYFGFLSEIFNSKSDFKLVLPVGISFYVFQVLGYTIDVYRDDIKAERNFFDYALFVSFFPQLLAGPIGRAGKLLVQFKEIHEFEYERIRHGLFRMLVGYFMKLVISNRLAIVTDLIYGNYSECSGYQMLLGTIAYAFQIYCDFASYSAIAIGAAEVLGIKLGENFRQPFFAVSCQDLWKRWHVSLNAWFRDYLYFPLGGSRKGKIRKYINTLIIFAASGLWHGAAWTYVIWGVLSGIFQVSGYILKPIREFIIGKIPFKGGFAAKCRKIFSILLTFILFLISLVFFKSTTIESAIEIERKIFTEFDLSTVFSTSFFSLGLGSLNFMILLISLFLLLVYDILNERTGDAAANILKLTKTKRWAIYYLLTLMIIGSANIGAAQFIYFDF